MDDDSLPTQARSRATETQQRMARGARDLQSEVTTRAKGKMGQPTKFTQELWDDVMDRLACCENIMDICQEPGMPSWYTIRRWWRADPELKRQVEQAWEDAAYLLHYVNDSMLAGGSMSVGDFRRDEARAANNRWWMGKANRRLFGDKTSVDLSSTVTITLPQWGGVQQGELIEHQDVLDADEVFEQNTVKRVQEAMREPAPEDEPR